MDSTPARCPERRSWVRPSRHAGPHDVQAGLGRALGVVAHAECPGVERVVPDVDRLVPLELAQPHERRALGVGLAAEAQVGRVEQGGGHGLGLEHHLVGARVERDRVAPRRRLDRGPGADRGAVEVAQAGRCGLGVAVGRVVAAQRRPVDPVDLGHGRAPRGALPGGGGQHLLGRQGRAVARGLQVPTRGHERGHHLGPLVGRGARGAVVPVVHRADRRGGRQAREVGVGRTQPGRRPGPLHQRGQVVRLGAAGRHPGQPALDRQRERHQRHVLGHVLVDAAVGEAGERGRAHRGGDQRVRPGRPPGPACARRSRRRRPSPGP